jgi:hypothetical protein
MAGMRGSRRRPEAKSGERKTDFDLSSLAGLAGDVEGGVTQFRQALHQDEAESQALLFVFFAIELLEGADVFDLLGGEAAALIADDEASIRPEFDPGGCSLAGKFKGVINQFLDDAGEVVRFDGDRAGIHRDGHILRAFVQAQVFGDSGSNASFHCGGREGRRRLGGSVLKIENQEVIP